MTRLLLLLLAAALGPKASFVATCQPLVCTMDATSSVGTRFKWSFGDGTGATWDTARVVRHSYSAAGTYSVVLVVADAAKLRSQKKHKVVVPPQPPLSIVSSSDGQLQVWQRGVQLGILVRVAKNLPLWSWWDAPPVNPVEPAPWWMACKVTPGDMRMPCLGEYPTQALAAGALR